MRILYVLILVLFLVAACKSNKTGSKGDTSNEENRGAVSKFDSIMEGLSKNYVLNFNSYNREDFYHFYDISPEEYLDDSVRYHQSVNAFFDCDSSTMTRFLLNNEGDTSGCHWIYSTNPYSSTLTNLDMHFSKEQAAAILLYDYWVYYGCEGAEITTSPSTVGEILRKVSLKKLDSILKINRRGPIDQISHRLEILVE